MPYINSCTLVNSVNTLENICMPLMAQQVKNPAVQVTQETWVRSLGWDDSLEKGKATHSSILAWRIPQTEEPSGLQSVGSQRVGHNLATKPPPLNMWASQMAQW